MADKDTGLPIRSEADGSDERVHSKIVGSPTGVNPATNQAAVDNDKNLHVESHGNDPNGTDRVIKTSEEGATAVDGVYDLTSNTEPSSVGLIASERDASPSYTTQTKRLTSISSSDRTALDIALLDESGNPFSASNPLPTTSVDSEGDEVNNFFTESDVVKEGTSNHIYIVTALKTLKLTQVLAAASGKMKIEVQIETGVATGVYATKFVGFNSTANPNIYIPINESISVAAGVRVRVIRTNYDNTPQDLYSTICGHEI
jgi:hypothetical protein